MAEGRGEMYIHCNTHSIAGNGYNQTHIIFTVYKNVLHFNDYSVGGLVLVREGTWKEGLMGGVSVHLHR